MRLTHITEPQPGYLSYEAAAAAAVLVRDVLAIAPGDQVLITTDTRSDLRVADVTANAVAAAGAVPMLLHYPAGGGYSGTPPRAVAAAVAACDTWVEYATGHLIYTEAWRAATAAGVQYVSLGGLDIDGLVRCIGQQDAASLSRIGALVVDRLTDAQIHMTTAAGSDIVFDNTRAAVGSFAMRANPEKRAIMLAGQVTWSLAQETTMTGTLVADGILAPPQEVGLLAQPVRLALDQGRITAIDGGPAAQALTRWLAEIGDPMLRRTAHISLGFNPGITAPSGRILEDERAFGDLDFGFGAWVDRDAAGHFDFTCRQVSLWCNDQPLMLDGRFADPEMRAICHELGVPGHAPASAL